MQAVNFSRQELAHIAQLLLQQRWITAKTMAHNPHEYTLRKLWKSDDDFIYTVHVIRRRGYKQRYGKSTYRCLDLDDHFYWTMGWPIGQTEWGWPRLNAVGTILINRKPLPSRAVTCS